MHASIAVVQPYSCVRIVKNRHYNIYTGIRRGKNRQFPPDLILDTDYE